jgi:hypothetical protein
MIIAAKKTIVTSNIDMEVIPVTVSKNAGPEVIIKMVADQYPNPLQTLMTEYVQNAIDSHYCAGKVDVPIEITLPSEFDQHYVVRDYGVSMTHEQVKNVYAVAMESGKTGSNAELGGYGIGKLVFSQYGGELWLTTWVDGLKTVYFYQLKDGFGGIGIVTQEESDEPTGVEVKIHIPSEDHADCIALAPYLYSYIPTRPIFKGVKNVDDLFESDYLMQNDKFSLPTTKPTGDREDGMIATIGGLPFPIEAYAAGVGDDSDLVNYTGAILHFGVGELEHPPNRASLTYSVKTKDAIQKRMAEFKTECVKIICDKIDDFTLFEARNYMSGLDTYNLFNGQNNFHAVAKICGVYQNGFVWRGIKVKHELKVNIAPVDMLVESMRYYYMGTKRNSNSYYADEIARNEKRVTLTFHDDNTYVIIEPDFGRSGKAKRMAKYMEDNSDSKTYLVTLAEGRTIESFHYWSEIPMDKLINIKDLEMPPRDASLSSGSGSGIRTVKKGGVLEYNSNNARQYDYSMKWGVHAFDEVPENDLDTIEGVYFPMKYYKPDVPEFRSANNHPEFTRMMYMIRMFYPDKKVYGVKPAEVKNLNDDMVPLVEFANRIAEKLNTKMKLYGYNYLSLNYASNHYSMSNNLREHTFTDPKITYLRDNLLKLVDQYKAFKDEHNMAKVLEVYNVIRDDYNFHMFDTSNLRNRNHFLDKIEKIVVSINIEYNNDRYARYSLSINKETHEKIEALYYYRNRKKIESENVRQARRKVLTDRIARGKVLASS